MVLLYLTVVKFVLSLKFNEYFVNVARNLNIDKYSNLDAPDFKHYLSNSVKNSLFLSPITDNEIRDIINSLDSNKSNDISPKLLKALCNSFCLFLHIFSILVCCQGFSLMNSKLQE